MRRAKPQQRKRGVSRKLEYPPNQTRQGKAQRIRKWKLARSSGWYDEDMCKYTCVGILVSSVCCTLCFLAYFWWSAKHAPNNSFGGVFRTKKGHDSIADVYAKSFKKEFASLKSVLLEIEKNEAKKEVWHGEALPQLIRFHTTPIETRSVPITKVSMSDLESHKCKSNEFYYMKNTDLPGMDISPGTGPNGAKTETEAECCIKCTETKNCEAFTWVVDGHQCWLKSGANKVMLGKKNLVSAISMKSYNLNVREQVMYEAARKNINSKTYSNELFWPKVDIINEYSGKRRRICTPGKDALAFLSSSDLKNPNIAVDNEAEERRAKRAFDRYKIIFCGSQNLNVANKTGEADSNLHSVETIQKLAFHRNSISVYEKAPPGANRNGLNAESYSITMNQKSDTIVITAPTTVGFLRGIERVSQFCADGYCNVTNVHIIDRPQYIHRGLLLDVGRRYIPISTLYMILDGMSAMLMNKLHWHLTDWVAVRWESKAFPELNAGKRFYKKQEIQDLVEYAFDRGIDVYPELDVPGHAHCFAGNNKVSRSKNGVEGGIGTFQFCDTKKFELFNDPNGKTLSGCKTLIRELRDLFPKSNLIHIGGDETEDKGSCNKQNFGALTKSLQKEVLESSGAFPVKPIVWNEVVNILKAGIDGTIVQAWSKEVNFTELLIGGHQIIFSQYEKMYLDFTSTSCSMLDVTSGKRCLWLDIGKDMPSQFNHDLLLGGEATMWTDEYCPHSKCVGHAETWGGKVGWLFKKKEDFKFTQNFLTMIFPRLNAAAGSFWNYDSKVSIEMFLRRYYNSYYHVRNRIKHVATIKHKHDLSNQTDPASSAETAKTKDTSWYNICPITDCDGCTMTHRCGITWKEYFKQFGLV